MGALPEKGKGGLGQFADLRGTWRKRGCFFGEGGGGGFSNVHYESVTIWCGVVSIIDLKFIY